MLGLERLEPTHQRIECLVGDLRRGVDVVQLFVAADFLTELFDLFGGCHTNSATESQRRRDTRKEPVIW